MSSSTRVLFIGWPDIVHNQQWMSLCEQLDMESQLFPIRGSLSALRGATLEVLNPRGDGRLGEEALRQRTLLQQELRDALRSYRPDVIHCFGIDPVGYFVSSVLADDGTSEGPSLIVQMRGGPEHLLNQHESVHRREMAGLFARCDGFLADNADAYSLAVQCGLSAVAQRRWPGPVPGGGGVGIGEMNAPWTNPPSLRPRRIVWPKAYQNASVNGASVVEGLRLAWPDIRPVELRFFFVYQHEFALWVRHALSADMLDSVSMHPKVPHATLLSELAEAPVLLAPSLLDGVPNVMLEGMATGALPIVSPHPTLPRVLTEEAHVFLARNLYPSEIAAAVSHAFSLTPETVDRYTETNREIVHRIAGRDAVTERVGAFYASFDRGAP